ncbi:hypothetical protein [Terricaulis sp.]|uniref:hypothetical protein n=1 Tax=Terricaulis sp. TaxID=2768686 RepID=UPI0037838DB0
MDLRSLSLSPYFWSLQDDAFLFTRHSPIEDFSDQRLVAHVAEIEMGAIFGPYVPPPAPDDVQPHHLLSLLTLSWLRHEQGDGVVETPTHNTIFGI